ncbi:hypothetical protein [Oceanicoccus sp. KOV_DT_Chl]|uniref:hypothetical protein n=1 Tax=Oceanicoccus sp. KOV_DT_Chl TaxID=1904639 RepID=UPI001F29F1A7|nr:hypothetical protein [Oceanicoccus sp. KOV_DT_Chl]
MLLLSPTTMTVQQTAELEKYRQQFIERNADYADWLTQCLQEKIFADQLCRTWLGSQFAADLCIRQPAMFKQLVESQQLHQIYNESTIHSQLAELLVNVETAEQLDQVLRHHRNREQLRVIWRDLNRLASLEETTKDISSLAEASIQQALDFHHQQLCQRYGTPTAKKSGQVREQKLLVLGMGKLGAWELNLSSDIDLIFCYPHSGETQGVEKPLTNSEFFTRLARKLIQSIDQQTADGFVFRVDMRLRPYGESGALVLSFSALEEYYQDQGRDWERYAMIKARVVAGETDQGEKLMALLRPFTYRRYIDFSAVDSLRSMKKMIRKEVQRRHLHNDVKLGAGVFGK